MKKQYQLAVIYLQLGNKFNETNTYLWSSPMLSYTQNYYLDTTEIAPVDNFAKCVIKYKYEKYDKTNKIWTEYNPTNVASMGIDFNMRFDFSTEYPIFSQVSTLVPDLIIIQAFNRVNPPEAQKTEQILEDRTDINITSNNTFVPLSKLYVENSVKSGYVSYDSNLKSFILKRQQVVEEQ